MQTLNLIGAGRVGQTLGRLWHRNSVFALQDVQTRSPTSAQAACAFMGAGLPLPPTATPRPADVWMLAVPDAQIAAGAQALAAQAAPSRGSPQGSAPLIFHCSGAQGSALLAPLAALGWQVASAHCILSFAAPEAALDQFPGTPCALEGDAAAIARLQEVFAAIDARCFEVQSEQKLLYHAAAVFATNFLPVLQSVAEDAWTASGVPSEMLAGLRAGLLHNAVANITRMGPRGALTGPAARGDVAAIATQGAVVAQWDADAGAAYTALSALALRLAKASTETSATPASKR